MTETDSLPNHQLNERPADAELYDESYFKCYHTGVGPVAYERNPHWLSFFATIADEIVRVFQPHTVLDAGCALGILVESFWDRGVRAEGIDISAYAIANVRPDMRGHCRVASLTDPIEGAFDLVTCVEVLEHLESADAERAIANICRVTDTVVFSSTPSDFDEPTHVNVSPPLVWIELFAAQGFGPDFLTDGTFLTPHTMIFRRGNPCDVTLCKAYAQTTRYRALCIERLGVIAAERNATSLAQAAQREADERCAREAQLRADAQAALEAEKAAIQAGFDAQLAAVRTELEDQLAAARTALEKQLESEIHEHLQARQRSDGQAALQAQLRAEAVGRLGSETQRLQTHIQNVESVLRDMQRSQSWRLTLPVRLAAIALRKTLNRLRRGSATGALGP